MKKFLTHFRRILRGPSDSIPPASPDALITISKQMFDELLVWKSELVRVRHIEHLFESEKVLHATARAEIARLTNLVRKGGGELAPAMRVTAQLNVMNEWIGECPVCAAPLRMEVAAPDE